MYRKKVAIYRWKIVNDRSKVSNSRFCSILLLRLKATFSGILVTLSLITAIEYPYTAVVLTCFFCGNWLPMCRKLLYACGKRLIFFGEKLHFAVNESFPAVNGYLFRVVSYICERIGYILNFINRKLFIDTIRIICYTFSVNNAI